MFLDILMPASHEYFAVQKSDAIVAVVFQRRNLNRKARQVHQIMTMSFGISLKQAIKRKASNA